MKITILGTGTSQGVPVIGCKCEVCKSKDSRDKRLRCSIIISNGPENIVVDTGPDFRQQMLNSQTDNLNAVLFTHEHNDHIIGIDDIRPFNFLLRKNIDVYAASQVQKDLRIRFEYVFNDNPYPGAPRLNLLNIEKEPFMVGSIKVIPIAVKHGRMDVLGFRFSDFTYITDANYIDEIEKEKIKGSKYLMVNALHHKKHHSHFNLEQALEFIDEIKPQKAYLTHISHRMGTSKDINRTLPKGVELGYDGLEIYC